MSTLLAEAIGQLNLRPGQTFRTTVQGNEVEVRILPAVPEPRPVETPAVEDESQFAQMVMLEPWFEFPDPPALCVVRAIPGPIDPMDPPILPPEDESA